MDARATVLAFSVLPPLASCGRGAGLRRASFGSDPRGRRQSRRGEGSSSPLASTISIAEGPRLRRLPPFFSLAILVLAASGCGYNIGNAYQRDVRTVFVPIATTEDYRRGAEFQLTEAVQKQIQ